MHSRSTLLTYTADIRRCGTGSE